MIWPWNVSFMRHDTSPTALMARMNPPWIAAHIHGLLDARLVVEHHRRIDDAGQAVLEHDVSDRDQQRKPVLVERDDADHHEVREVHLDAPVEQVHQHR